MKLKILNLDWSQELCSLHFENICWHDAHKILGKFKFLEYQLNMSPFFHEHSVLDQGYELFFFCSWKQYMFSFFWVCFTFCFRNTAAKFMMMFLTLIYSVINIFWLFLSISCLKTSALIFSHSVIFLCLSCLIMLFKAVLSNIEWKIFFLSQLWWPTFRVSSVVVFVGKVHGLFLKSYK